MNKQITGRLASMLEQLPKLVQQIFFPPLGRCSACRQKVRTGQFCRRCWGQLSRSKKQEFCRKCGRILASNHACPECRGVQSSFSFARAVGPYQGIFQDLLQQFKYTGKQSLARPMGRLMADVVLTDPRFTGIQLVLPIPLAPSKFAQRKFNQSELLAREIADILGLPILPAVLWRVKTTQTQAKLSKQAREANLAGAFEVNRSALQHIKGKKLLLIDDVLTTGSTCNAAATVLLAKGAHEVAVLTWATGLAHQSRGKRGKYEPKEL